MLPLEVQHTTSAHALLRFEAERLKLACNMHTAHDSWAQCEQCNHAGMLAVTAMGQK